MGGPFARSVRPSSRADVRRAEAPKGAAGKQVGKQRCGRVNAEKLRVTATPKFTVRSEGPAPYRILTIAKHEHAPWGSKPSVCLLGPHHPDQEPEKEV